MISALLSQVRDMNYLRYLSIMARLPHYLLKDHHETILYSILLSFYTLLEALTFGAYIGSKMVELEGGYDELANYKERAQRDLRV